MHLLDKITSAKQWGQEIGYVVFGQMLVAVGSLVGVRMLTEVLPPEVYGQIALALTIVALSQQLMVGPLAGGFGRFYSLAQENLKIPALLSAVVWLEFRQIVVIIFFGLILSGGLILIGLSNSLGLVIGTTIFALCSGINVGIDSIQTSARNRAIVALHQGVFQWLRFLLAVFFIGVFGPLSSVGMGGYALAAFVVLLSQFYFFRQKIAPELPVLDLFRPPDPWIIKIYNFAIPLMSWGIFTWAQMASDRWALQIFSGVRDVGYYSAVYQLGYYPFVLVSTVVTQFISPILYIQTGDGLDPLRRAKARQTTNLLVFWTLVITGFATLFSAFFHQPLFSFLIAPEYSSTSVYMPWLVLSAGLFSAGQMASMFLISLMKTELLMVPKVVTAIAGVGLNFIGAAFFHLNGVIFAGLAFSLIYFTWIMILNSKNTY